MTLTVTQQPTNMVGQKIKSAVWGNVEYEVTQDFGVVGFRPDWYDYSRYHGFPPGYHIGIDVGTPKLTPVYANEYANVKAAGFSDSFRPNPVILETTDDPRTSDNEAGFTETYGHLWQDAVTTGQHVKPGDLIGYTGEQTVMGTMTPDGSGPHIHFEVYDQKGNAINPLPFLGVKFTPQPGGTSPNQYDYKTSIPGVSNLTDVGNAIGGLTKTLSDYAGRGLIAIGGFILVIFGLYAMSRPGGVGGAVKGGTKLAKKGAKIAAVA